MARLPRGAEIGNVIQVQCDESHVEVRNVKMPFPFIVGQLEETSERRSVDVVNRLFGRLAPTWSDFLVMVAQDWHERRGAEQIGVGGDEFGVGLDAALVPGTAWSVDTGYVVASGQQFAGLGGSA
jgi:hypothetical protein